MICFRTIALSGCLLLGGAMSAAAQQDFDRIKTAGGFVNGPVVKFTPNEVTVKQTAGQKVVPVNEIDSIEFFNEPTELKVARNSYEAGRHDVVLTEIVKVKPESIQRDLIKQDVQFYKSMALAHQAIGGNGDQQEAGRQLLQFLRDHPESFHYYAANETLGDLLVAMGRYDQAQTYFAKLAGAPWPDFQMRAAVAVGQALAAQGKHAEAMKSFDEALAVNATGERAQRQKMAATIGKASSMASTGGGSDSIKLLEEVIAKAPAEETEIHARAYNALGSCQKQAGNKKEALLAYLHVDLLYNSVPDAHAEALASLVELWPAVNKAGNSREAQEVLETRYPNSRWSK